jgi:hypothetical protein
MWDGGGGKAPSGHSLGLQVVRVRTRRGFVLLASDAMHYYENIDTMRAYASSAPSTPTLNNGLQHHFARAPFQIGTRDLQRLRH